jgi:hypothetical protein
MFRITKACREMLPITNHISHFSAAPLAWNYQKDLLAQRLAY